jgi:catechol 2,3-dioxygenase-like lactoylglutathione lyase family enzyme
MQILGLDHLVLTVANIETTVAFYEKLGMQRQTFGEGRVALRFGEQKINLHERGAEVSPHAAHPVPGSADLCFLVADPIEDVLQALSSVGIAVEEGPVDRTGTTTPLLSVYLRDPDDNLVELSRPR